MMRFFQRRPAAEVIPDPGYAGSGTMRVGEAPYDRDDCPYCRSNLDPMPKAKKRCPACGEPIYVRSGPDGVRYLLRESDLDAHAARWESYYDGRNAQEDARLNREAAEQSRQSLNWYRESAILYIAMSTPDRKTCPACRAFAGREIEIDDVPPIPVPGCTNTICRCVYSPVADR